MKKFFKYLIEYFFLFYLVNFFRLFPLKIGLKIASFLGSIIFYLDKTHRLRAINNLKLAFPEKGNYEILKICKNVFINLAKNFFEFIKLPDLDKDYFKKNFRIIGEENLKRALQKKKGIVAVTSHLGNWELLGALVVKMGYKLVAVYHPMKNPFSDRFINRIRRKAGIELISMKDSLRGGLKALKENKLLGLISDQDAGSNGIFIKFFGKEASTFKGPAIFAIKTKAPMILFNLIREKDDKHTLYISEEFQIKDDIYLTTELWSNEVEKWIIKYPEQWFWVHRRWHTKKKY